MRLIHGSRFKVDNDEVHRKEQLQTLIILATSVLRNRAYFSVSTGLPQSSIDTSLRWVVLVAKFNKRGRVGVPY